MGWCTLKENIVDGEPCPVCLLEYTRMRAVVVAARELYEDHIDPSKEYAQPLGEALAMLDKSGAR